MGIQLSNFLSGGHASDGARDRVVSRNWLEALSSVKGGGRAPDIVRVLDRTPQTLVGLGFPNMPWYTDGGHVSRELKWSVDGGHGIKRDVLENIDLFLDDPVLVSIGDHRGLDRERKRIVIALDAVNDVDEPVVAVADLNGDVEGEPCVWLATVSGRSNPTDFFHATALGGGMALFDEGRLTALLSRSGANLTTVTRCTAVDPDLVRKFKDGEVEVVYDDVRPGAPVAEQSVPAQVPSAPEVIEVAATPETAPEVEPAAEAEAVSVSVTGGDPVVGNDPVADFDRRVIEPLRHSVDNWFFEHRYDVINGDVHAFIDRISRKLAAGIVLTGTVPGDADVDAAVVDALHEQITEEGR